jgi:hypothetical protein
MPVACLPRRGDPTGICDRAVIEARIAQFGATTANGSPRGD